MIKPGNHEVTSESKDTAYIATVLLFQNIQQMACKKVGGWELTKTVTDNDSNYFVTEYSNGRMFIRATSHGDSHLYSFGEESNLRICATDAEVDSENGTVPCKIVITDSEIKTAIPTLIKKPKPLTKVTYEEVEFNHAWEAVKAFEEGEVFYANDNGIRRLQHGSAVSVAVSFCLGHDLYRKVEKEIDWRDEVSTYLNDCDIVGGFDINESGIKINDRLNNACFLEVCRAALRATGELESEK